MLNASTTRFPFLRPLLGLALCTAVLAPAKAELKFASQGSELVLMLLDQKKAEMTYIKDLGLVANDFWITAQQDAGASLFKTLDPGTDPALKTFLDNADLASVRWIVMANNIGSGQEIEKNLYFTLNNSGSVATQSANFETMKSIESRDFNGPLDEPFNYLKKVAGANPQEILMSTLASADNGSALASNAAGNTLTYAGMRTRFFAKNNNLAPGDCVAVQRLCMGNPLGTSSWFYRATAFALDGEVDGYQPIVYDEFDNLSGDGYWGLIKDPSSSNYILSYSLAGSNPRSLVSTDFGRSRLSFTDYSAQSGFARQILALAGDDVANAADAAGTFLNGGLAAQQAVTAVPEPQSWGLMVLGLLGLAAHARRRSSSNGA
jgi:MYXO-CTERM domain-containing protein